MTAHVAFRRGRARGPALLYRPQLVAELVAGSAWISLVELHAGPTHRVAPGSLHAYLHAVPAVAAASASSPLTAVLAGLPGWMLMSAAMMTTAALPTARHVAVNSLQWRRHRAVGEFLVAYLLVWAAFGAVVLAAMWWWPPTDAALLVALIVAAAWQFSSVHTRLERDCHRMTPLPPSGRAAICGTTRLGLRYGRACVGSCWALMLIMAVATTGHLAWTICLTAGIAAQRMLSRPRHRARVLGGLLAVAAGILVAL